MRFSYIVDKMNNNHRQLQKKAVQEFLSLNHRNFKNSEVLVYIPVLNEEDTIAQVVEGIRRSCDFDVMVVDDGSTDTTPLILQNLNVEVLRHPVAMGTSNILSALEVGLALGYKYIIKIDGDGQQDPCDIPRLYSHAFQTGADTVIGSRHLNQLNVKIWSIEGSGMWFCSKMVSLLSRKLITDTTSGFKIWNKRSAEVIIRAFNEGKIKDDKTCLIEELLITARKGLSIEEISVKMYPRLHGESKSYASKKKLAMFPIDLIRSTLRAYF